MAYEKHNWVCGETITADLLNNIEGGVEEALECCGSGGDVGYECTETYQQFQSESIDIQGETSFYLNESPDVLRVTLNGNAYICNNSGSGSHYDYGDQSLSEYPFHIWHTPYGAYIAVAEDGEYELTFEALSETVTSTACFKKAAASVFEIHSFTAGNTQERSLQPNRNTSIALDVTVDGETVNDLSEYDFILLKRFMTNPSGLIVCSVDASIYPAMTVLNPTSNTITIHTNDLEIDGIAVKINKQ